MLRKHGKWADWGLAHAAFSEQDRKAGCGAGIVKSKKGVVMYQGQLKTAYDEALEYHGSTTVEVTRCRHGRIIWRDWLIFDSVAEASEYYNSRSQGSGERIRWIGRERLPRLASISSEPGSAI